MLSWAAKLHEIGLSVAHNGYHKHSAYILRNADMPGFSKMEQSRLATLVLAHRGSLDKMQGLLEGEVDLALVAAMRLAALFYRSRVDCHAAQASKRTTRAPACVSSSTRNGCARTR